MPWAGTYSCSLMMPPLVFPFSLSLFSLFILETQVKLERQMFLFARPCRMTCSFRRLLPFLPPYRVTAGPCRSLWAFKEAQRKEQKKAQNKVEADSWRVWGGWWEPPVESVPNDPTGISGTGEKIWLIRKKQCRSVYQSAHADVSKGQILYSLQFPAESMLWKYELWPLNAIKHLDFIHSFIWK